MVSRGGGVKGVALRELSNEQGRRSFSFDISINVC
jgi:hypothetical protein